MARSGGFWAGLVFGGAAVGAVVATAYFTSTYEPVTHSGACTVTAADGATFTRSAEQADNAALVAAGAAQRGMGTNAATVGIATAIQESGLRNLDYGDRDSLGLFQQRPSQGWGTEEEVQDRHFATRQFYRHLARVDGWEKMRVTEAAQAVQRSAFPEAYADHEAEAAAWAAALRGDAGFPTVDCDLEAATTTSTAADFVARLDADWGEDAFAVEVLGVNSRAVLLGITATSGDARDAEAIANWSVAVADAQAVASVRLGDVAWLREQGVTRPDSPAGFAGVLVGVVTAVR